MIVIESGILMNYFISKPWIFPLVAGASISLFLVFITQVLPQGGLAQPGSTPLSPNHPDAKLDPNLVNVPAMPEQNTNTTQRYPLAPDHPDAKLDPNLVNVPAMPERTTETPESSPTQTPDQEVNYDSRTGTSGVGETKPVKPPVKPTEVNAPNSGTGSK
jgi:hypothetical protein